MLKREHVIWVLLAGFAYALFLVLEPFWTSIAWAAILAALLAPLLEWLERWIPGRGTRALLVSAVAALIVLGPFLLLVLLGALELTQELQLLQSRIQRASGLVDILPEGWLAAIEGWVRRLDEIDLLRGVIDAESLRELLRNGINRGLQGTLDLSSLVVTDLISLSVVVSMTWIALFFLLRDGPRLMQLSYDLLPFAEKTQREFADRLREMLISVLACSLAVAILQGTLGGIGFAFAGIPRPVLWGVIMVPLALVPFFGTGLVWLPAVVILAFQGSWGAALFLTVWGSTAIALVDNFLRPMLLSGRASLHPLLAFLGVLGGVQAFGVVGLFLGPVIIATLATLVEFQREEASANG